MRIAILKREIHSGGGLEKYFRKICEALLLRGHQVTVLSMEECESLPVVRVCRKVPFSVLNMIWFDINARRWLRRHPQDIVLGLDRHFLPLTHYRAGNGCHAAFLQRRKKESSWMKRFFLSCNPLHLATLFSERKTFESTATKTICNSHLVRREILRFYPRALPTNIVVIHNGVEWQALGHSFQEREHSSVSQLLFVGNEWRRKGLDRILMGLALLNTPFFFTAIGKERTPKPFFSLIEELNLENKVKLIPEAGNPLPFYKKSSIMLIPSRYDPFANVTLEALAMGLFVITTEANGGAEAITPHNGIVLKESARPEDFAEAIALGMSLSKNTSTPELIRDTVKQYDFSKKLEEFVRFLEQS